MIRGDLITVREMSVLIHRDMVHVGIMLRDFRHRYDMHGICRLSSLSRVTQV